MVNLLVIFMVQIAFAEPGSVDNEVVFRTAYYKMITLL